MRDDALFEVGRKKEVFPFSLRITKTDSGSAVEKRTTSFFLQRFAAAIYAAYDAVVATGKVGAADGSVLGPQVDATLLAGDPPPQRIGRQTIATMVAECKTMDTAMMGREKMI